MNTETSSISEPARNVPVAFDCDICVVGGSCTGVFAAVRAARRGLRVALVEQQILFGGMATAAQVNEWHSQYDIHRREKIIAGLTEEILVRLRARGAATETVYDEVGRTRFNSAELALELDALVREHDIRPFLSARCVGAVCDGPQILAAVIEDKSGRRAIRARQFIDASGDGDLLRRAGFEAWRNDVLQPVNYQHLVAGLKEVGTAGLWERVRHLAGDFEYPLENATPWFFQYPAPADVTNVFGPRLNGVDASDADQLTAAVLEGRRRQRALLDMIRSAVSPHVSALALAHSLGIRETWHARCLQRLTGDELLAGTSFPDRIACGTYPVDIHSPEGTLLRFLNGEEKFVKPDGTVARRRWREEENGPGHYSIPYRSLVPAVAANLLVAGRLLDADRAAFGGARVMVNMNQTGEAAGEAAAICCEKHLSPRDVEPGELRGALVKGGSADVLSSSGFGDGECKI